MRVLLRSHLRFFLVTATCGLGLRLLFLIFFPAITSDSFIYGDIAKNWLLHGIYGVSDGTAIVPTYIRLPGYPMFLSAVFSIFGMEHYRAVLVIQMFVDMASCFVIADIARRLLSDRAAKVAFLLAVLCPFFANYAAAALTETWEIFFTSVALDLAVAGLKDLQARSFLPWMGSGIAIGCAILLRPDGGLLLAAIVGYLAMLTVVSFARKMPSSSSYFLRACVLIVFCALAPLVPWTLRNLHTLHRFEPLAPRYANAADEFVPLGFNRWVKTWMVDYVSVEEIYWASPGSTMDSSKLPTRAFDSLEQQEETGQLLSDYNGKLHVTPELDERFTKLADDLVHHSLFRYYIGLPAARIADMWLRPRTEILPSDSRWWEFDDDLKWSALAVALGVINLLYFVGGIAGVVKRKLPASFALLLLFVVLRSAFLGSLENPETRYTLECYPVLILMFSMLKN